MTRKMKDSGIEWIGEIPEDWGLVRVKSLFLIGRGRVISQTELEKDGKYPVYSSQTKNNGCLGYIKTYDFDRSQLTWTTDGANAGTIFLREGKYNCTNVCGTLFPKTNDNLKFLKYSLEYTAIYHKRLDTNGYKIMNNEMAEIKLVIPKIDKQINIANYLDTKCSKIDETIQKEKQVIEKLKQYKQSIITEAVTKGLDSDVKMKDSGVEWIGDIPEHWSVKKLKYLFRIKKNIAGELGYDILSVTQSGIKIKDISKNDGQLSMDYSKYQLVEKDDFIMNHMDLLTGFVDCSKYSGVTSPDYRVFKLLDSQNHRGYYNFIFQSCYYNKIFYGLGQGVSGLGRWRLQTDKFINFVLPIPPVNEQKIIYNYIRRKIVTIDKAISNKEKLIEKLTEYKKSLIYECVTGKREV